MTFFTPLRGLLLSLIFAPFLTSCADEVPTGPPATTVIAGSVVDANGTPVAGAKIGLFFTFEASPLDTMFADTFLLSPYPNPAIDNTTIGFEVLSNTRVQADLLRYHTRDTARHLVDEVLTAGTHQLSASFTGLPNGGYVYLTRMGGTPSELLMILNNPDTLSFTPLLTTDNTGKFSLERANLPIGESFPRSFESGAWGGYQKVAKRLGLVIRRPDGTSRVEWVTIDSDNLTNLTIKP